MTKDNFKTIAVFTEKGGLKLQHTPFVFNDGGRAEAGYKGKKAGDCVTRAIAIATGKPYQEVFDALNELAKSERTGKRKKGVSNANTGVYKDTTRKYLLSLGAKWTPTMQIGQGCKVHLRADELPMGRLVVKVSKHAVAVIDGVIHDTYNADREGTRCVYGYYTIPSNKAIISTKAKQPTQEHQSVPETPVKAKRTGKSDADKLSELAEKVKRWNTKKKRADNMLKKLAKKVKYYQKKINK